MSHALFPPTARYLVDGHEVDLAHWLELHREVAGHQLWRLVALIPGETVNVGFGMTRYDVQRIENVDPLAISDQDHADASRLVAGNEDGIVTLLVSLARAVTGAPWPDLRLEDRERLLDTLAFTAEEALALVEALR